MRLVEKVVCVSVGVGHGIHPRVYVRAYTCAACICHPTVHSTQTHVHEVCACVQGTSVYVLCALCVGVACLVCVCAACLVCGCCVPCAAVQMRVHALCACARTRGAWMCACVHGAQTRFGEPSTSTSVGATVGASSCRQQLNFFKKIAVRRCLQLARQQ